MQQVVAVALASQSRSFRKKVYLVSVPELQARPIQQDRAKWFGGIVLDNGAMLRGQH
jgi:hypothetical protein